MNALIFRGATHLVLLGIHSSETLLPGEPSLVMKLRAENIGMQAMLLALQLTV
jgi:hypothetical protein